MAKIAGIHTPIEPRNLAINGAFDFWQRFEGNTQTVSTTAGATTGPLCVADMWNYYLTGATAKSITIGQSTSLLPTVAQSGFSSTYSNKATTVSALGVPAASDLLIAHRYVMEGLDYQNIVGKTVTIGFWAYSSVAGSFPFAVTNGGGTRSYVTTFNIAAANTWQFISITLTMDVVTTGYTFTNTGSVAFTIAAVAGSTYQTSTLNTWQSGALLSTGTAANWASSTSNSFIIAQFSIVEGALGFGATGFRRAGKTIQQELALCQRYYEKTYDIGTALGTVTNAGLMSGLMTASSAVILLSAPYKVTKRAAGTAVLYNGNSGATGTWHNAGGTDTSVSVVDQGLNSLVVTFTAPAANSTITGHWIVDAGMPL